MTDERDRWNARYRDAVDDDRLPALLVDVADDLPGRGRAVDLAGGRGVVAVELARRGYEVTLVDVSDVALELAAARAERAGVTLRCMRVDLAAEPVPAGPWDLICCFHYLDRALLGRLGGLLAPGGLLLVAIATRTNLERHERASAPFLLDDGELPGLVGDDLEVVHHHEGWDAYSRHEAWLVARRPS